MFQSRRKVKTKNKTYNYCADNKTTGESGKPIGYTISDLVRTVYIEYKHSKEDTVSVGQQVVIR